jgi:hypothetical protein
MKGQVYSQRENTTLDESKARITAAIANITKDMLQCVWKNMTTDGMYAELRMKLIVRWFA